MQHKENFLKVLLSFLKNDFLDQSEHKPDFVSIKVELKNLIFESFLKLLAPFLSKGNCMLEQPIWLPTINALKGVSSK